MPVVRGSKRTSQTRGRCLVDYELEQLVQQGTILLSQGTSLAPSQIQPASFEPRLADEAYLLDTETIGRIRPHADATIEQIIHEIPRHQKTKLDITQGEKLQVGHTYLVRIQEQLRLNDPSMRVKFSPRSSTGRVFLRTRLLADYNACIDEAQPIRHKETPLALWLLLEPLAFPIVVRPGQSLTQGRFFVGYDARLSDGELYALKERQPLLYQPPLGHPARHNIFEGLEIHLDLEGQQTKGIVGLRTRHRPEAIDLQTKGAYDPLDFFEPVRMRNHGDTLSIAPGHNYLLFSQEVIAVPPDYSAELQEHAWISLDGHLHLAGFFDPGFKARCVFEVRSTETGKVTLSHGMPMTRFSFYRGNRAQTPYGSSGLGSSFQGQTGPQPPKCFKPIDYSALSFAMQKD